MIFNGTRGFAGVAGDAAAAAAGDGATGASNESQETASASNGGGVSSTTLTTGAKSTEGTGGASGSPGAPEWALSLPDELKSSPSLANHKDLPSFVKSALEAEKLIGKKGLIKPGESATPEEVNAFYKELGKPEKAEQYDLKKPEKFSDNLQYNEALVPQAKDLFHKANLSSAQAEVLWAGYHEMIGSAADQQFGLDKKVVDQGISALKQEWGGDEKYAAKVETAVMAVKEFGGDELVNFLESTGLGNHPALIKTFANIGQGLREDSFEGGRSKGVMTAAKAQVEIERLNNDKEFTNLLYSTKLEDKDRVTAAQKQMENLYKIAYPTFTN